MGLQARPAPGSGRLVPRPRWAMRTSRIYLLENEPVQSRVPMGLFEIRLAWHGKREHIKQHVPFTYKVFYS